MNTLTNLSLIFLVIMILQTSLGYIHTLPKRSIKTRNYLFGNPEPPSNSPAKKDGGGMFGNMGQMGNMMESIKKAQEIAKQAESLNKELAATVIIGSDPTGQVTSTFTGIGSPIGIKISDAILAQGSEAVSLAATQAMIDGYNKAQLQMTTKLQSIYGGMMPK